MITLEIQNKLQLDKTNNRLTITTIIEYLKEHQWLEEASVERNYIEFVRKDSEDWYSLVLFPYCIELESSNSEGIIELYQQLKDIALETVS